MPLPTILPPDDPPAAAWVAYAIGRAGGESYAARRLHVSRQRVHRWLRGTSPMEWAHAELLRRMLNADEPLPEAPPPEAIAGD